MNYKLCKKEKEDFDENINANYSKSLESKKYFRQKITKKSNFAFVAIDGNKVVGYIAGGLIKIEDYMKHCKLAEVENMFILEDYRRKGVGKRLMDEMFKWCKSNGIERIRVIASFQNILGINFYKREGFNEYNLVLEKGL